MRIRMKRRWTAVAASPLLGLVLLCGSAAAQQQSGAGGDGETAQRPAGASSEDAGGSGAAGESLTVTVTGVDGLVQVRGTEEEPWEMAQKGMELSVGAEFRTGPRSAVRFRVGDSQTITLDRLGTIKVLEAIRREGKVQTEAGMKYGRSSLEVEGGGVEHETNLHTPSAMLAVRGSRGFIEEYVNRLRSGSDFGDVAWYNAEGEFIPLPPGAEQEEDDTSTAENRKREGTYIPIWLATYGPEDELFSHYTSGVFWFLERDGRQHSKEKTTQETFEAPTTSGFTLVEAFWDSSSGGGDMSQPSGAFQQQELPQSASDVDLVVTTPNGEEIGLGRIDPDGHLAYRGRSAENEFSEEIDAVSPEPGQHVSEFVGGDTALFSGGDGEVLVGAYEARLTNNGPAPADLRVLIDSETGGGDAERQADLNFEPLNPGESRNVIFIVPEKTPGP